MMIMHQRFRVLACLTVLVGFGAYALQSTAQEPKKAEPAPKKEVAKGYEETILAHFKQPTDTASLIAYLKEHSASDEDLLAILDLIKQLGSNQFTQRDAASKKLVAIGLPALMPLLDATHDPDAERAGRAKLAMEKMDRGTHTVAVPAVTVRLLIKRKPPELLEMLLRFLPYTTDPDVEEDIYDGIDELAVKKDTIDPMLVKALEDKLPARRGVAGCIVARAGNAEQKQAAQKLLNDVDANVRLRTAQGFLAASEKTGIPMLIDLLDGKSAFIAWQAEELLVWAACGSAPKELIMSGGEKAKKAKAAWRAWWTENQTKIDLQKAAKQGRTPWLLASSGCTVIAGSDGRSRWKAPEGVKQCNLLINNRFVTFVTVELPRPARTGVDNELFFCEYELNEAVRHKTRLAEGQWLLVESRNVFSANGIVRCFTSSSETASVGVEGRYLGSNFRIGGDILGCTDGLIWNRKPNRPGNGDEILLNDPEGAAVLWQWKPSENKELIDWKNVYAFSRGRLLITTKTGLWSYDFDKLRCVREFNSPAEAAICGICRVGRNRFAVCDDRGHLVAYSSDWQVLSRVPCECYFFYEPIRQLMPLVGFGFR